MRVHAVHHPLPSFTCHSWFPAGLTSTQIWHGSALPLQIAAFVLVAYSAGIKRAQAQLETFQQNAPAYNSSLFQGKGIVIMAGGLTYFVPAWINIHMLRKAGMHGCLSLLISERLKPMSRSLTCMQSGKAAAARAENRP